MLPANPLLDSGISNPSILQVISNSLSYTLALFSTNLSSTGKLLNPSTRSVFLSQVASHHKTTGVVFITLGLIRFLTMYKSQFSINCIFINNSSWSSHKNPNLSSQVNLIPYNPLPLHTSCMVIRFPHHWFRSSCINIQLAWITNIWDKTSRPHILTPQSGYV